MLDSRIKSMKSFTDILGYWAANTPEKICYIFIEDKTGAEQSVTYKELFDQAKNLSHRIARQAKVGERVLLLYPPGIDFVVAMYACLMSGTIAVPVYPPANKALVHKLVAIAKDSEPSVILCASSVKRNWTMMRRLSYFISLPWIGSIILKKFDRYRELLESSLISTSVLEHCTDPVSSPPKLPPASGSDLGYLQYTSGSTGAPKGVMISHLNLVKSSVANFERISLDQNTISVSWLPPYHDLGLVGGIFIPILGGGTSVLMSPFSFLRRPAIWVETISKYKANMSGGPPFAYDLVARKATNKDLENLDLSSWKQAFVGSEPIHPNALEKFLNRFTPCGFPETGLIPGYGLAEFTLVAASRSDNQPLSVRNFNTEALKNHQILEAPKSDNGSTRLVNNGWAYEDLKIVDPDNGIPLPDQTIGEIWVKGESVAIGYWQKPNETKDTFAGDIKGDGGKWLRSGDLGFLIEGELYITGRIKDLIIIKGQNFYPQDIEFTVSHAHEAIRPGCTATFAVNGDSGEGFAIVSEIKPGFDGESYEPIIKDILHNVAREHSLTPKRIVLIPSRQLPKTTSGKIARHPCKRLLEQGDLDALTAWSAEDCT